MSSKTAPDAPAPPPTSWSLATRLTLWYAVSSFVLIAASTAFMYWALIDKLESEDDQFMAEKVELVRVLLRGPSSGVPSVPPRDGGWGEASRPAASVYLRVLGADGR